jgi:predicted nucleic acid-binding protein
MVVVDTSVWIDHFNGRKTAETEWLDAALGQIPIALGDLVLAELLQGFATDREA